MRAALLPLVLLLVACDGSTAIDAGIADAAPRECRSHARCDDRLCAVDGIPEIEVEDGELGVCTDEPRVGRTPTWTLRPNDPQICVAGGLSPGASAEVLDRQIALLVAAGVELVRLDFRWAHLEPAPGTIDFLRHDPMVDAARAAGIEVLAILAYGVPWATEAEATDEFYPPDDPADFERYVREVVRHYDGRIDQFEIWNEPNGGYRFWKPSVHGDAVRFAELQRRAARAIREECADCTIHSAGLFFHEQVINGAVEFTHDLLSADGDALDDIDVFAFHPYPRYPPQDPPDIEADGVRSFSGMDDDLRAVLALHDVDRPIGVTELGWPVYGTVDEDTQAILLSRAFLLGAALGWDPICWFNVTDGPRHGTFPPEDDFGLYRFGSEDPALPIDPKPARDALVWIATLGAFTAANALHAPEQGRFALDFGSVTAIWSLDSQMVSIDETGEVRDHFGGVIGSTPAMITIGPAPQFIVR
jgi:hypothetical protein